MSESNWGGRRVGSGRKKTGAGAVFVSTTISGSPDEIRRLKDNAAAAGQSVSRFVLDRLAQVDPVDQDTERLISKLQYENYSIKAGRAMEVLAEDKIDEIQTLIGIKKPKNQ